jgi:hypothetical protein
MLSAIFEGCRYEEGPVISFRSVKKRLLGTWTVTGYTSDGIDSLQSYKDSCGCEVEFPNPNTDAERWQLGFTHCYSYFDSIGFVVICHYSFSNNKNIMSIDKPVHPISEFGFKSFGPMLVPIDWEILRLTNDDFKISANTNNHNYIVTFKKAK